MSEPCPGLAGLTPGDVMDVTPLLDDSGSLPWDWNGMYDIDREASEK
ncbi:hypothetical protein [Mycolicibacter senuensis]|nr:hypothetical protein [Mycolicibacter senuensis]